MADDAFQGMITKLLPWGLALLSAGAAFGLIRSGLETANEVNRRQDLVDASLSASVRQLELDAATGATVQNEIRSAQERMEGQLNELLRGQRRAFLGDGLAEDEVGRRRNE